MNGSDQRFQFGLASLLIVITAFAVWCAVELRPTFQAAGIRGIFESLLSLAITIPTVVGMWRLFEKAGQPGWGALIPIYNLYLLFRIARYEWWYFLLMLVPLINIFVLIAVHVEVARCFGKNLAWGLGLLFLGFVFFPILGLGSAKYTAPE